LSLLDNKVSKIGEKRNLIIKQAKGKYVCFVDDDDRVEPDYIDAILDAIGKNPNVDVIVFDSIVHGYAGKDKICKYGKEHPNSNDDPDVFRRKPNHLMVHRTDIARRCEFKQMQVAEDVDWSIRMAEHILTQARIEKALYHYNFNIAASTQIDSNAMTARDVSYIVLKAVDSPFVERCLRSIKAHAPESETILVCNGCDANLAEKMFVDALHLFEVNVGFAAGCNMGASLAKRPIICFMNDDAEFVDDTPQKLAKSAAAGEIAAPYSNRAKPPQGDIPREAVPQTDIEPEAVVGVCMMLTTENFWKIGGFDTRLLTYEDDDFCAKARDLGIKCRVVGGTWVNHERHATFQALNLDVHKVMDENRRKFKRLWPKIKIICIAKDEEASIEGFFKQFLPVSRDWCMLDTGSTDKTIEIAKSIGVRVEHGEFQDFAQARNLAVEKFTNEDDDWVVMIDPDERLDQHTLSNLREFLANTTQLPSSPEYGKKVVLEGQAIDIVLVPLQAVYPDGSIRKFVAKPIAYRRDCAIRWIFKVHEKLIGSDDQVLLMNATNSHIIALHDQKRRVDIEDVYSKLMGSEPYFTNPEYKAKMRADWPILDYDKLDDDRIRKVFIGPMISVITPTYNRPEMLKKAVVSILKQDYPNLEIIIVGDNCPALPSLAWPERVRVFNLPKNHGAGGAVPRNYGIMQAAGQLIAYLDDDCTFLPDHLSTLYAKISSGEFSYALGSFRMVEPDGSKSVDIICDRPRLYRVDTSAVMHKKSLVRKFGYWRDRIEATYSHDFEFVSRWKDEPYAISDKITMIYVNTAHQDLEFIKAQ
jgi:glycosyltransferase involved in cell wall biosynthesis